MFLLAVTVVAVAIFFLLTTLVFAAERRVSHPVRVTAALTAVLALGLVLLLE